MTKVRGIGGAEQHLLTLLPELRAHGIDARFISLDAGDDSTRMHRELDERGVPWTRVPTGLDISPRLAAGLLKAVRREAPDLVHTHMVHADVYGSLAARAFGLPFVSTRHNDDRYLLGPFRHVDRAFMRGARAIIAISDAVRTFHIRAGLPANKLVTVHYGLDDIPAAPSEVTPAALGVPDGAPLVLAVGRLIEQKDHATLLAAFARVHADHPEARLAILGWGRLEAQTRAQVRELGIEGSVLLPGRVEPRDWLIRADVFVHTSRWEGFGIVLLEAMLARLPIVATRASAIPEVVADGTTGLLSPPGDVAAIAGHLSTLLADPGLRAALGAAGEARAREEFSIGRMAQRTMEVYRRALAP